MLIQMWFTAVVIEIGGLLIKKTVYVLIERIKKKENLQGEEDNGTDT